MHHTVARVNSWKRSIGAITYEEQLLSRFNAIPATQAALSSRKIEGFEEVGARCPQMK